MTHEEIVNDYNKLTDDGVRASTREVNVRPNQSLPDLPALIQNKSSPDGEFCKYS